MVHDDDDRSRLKSHLHFSRKDLRCGNIHCSRTERVWSDSITARDDHYYSRRQAAYS